PLSLMCILALHDALPISPSQRLTGVSIGARPIETRFGGLGIRSTYFSGEGTTIGFGQEGDVLYATGEGVGVAVDSDWFDERLRLDRKSTRLNSSHVKISY